MIRNIERKDKENWVKLYCGYAKFYKAPMNQGILNTLWDWIQANNWDGIRWITHSSNKNAKKLYNKIANYTGFELYELKGN